MSPSVQPNRWYWSLYIFIQCCFDCGCDTITGLWVQLGSISCTKFIYLFSQNSPIDFHPICCHFFIKVDFHVVSSISFKSVHSSHFQSVHWLTFIYPSKWISCDWANFIIQTHPLHKHLLMNFFHSQNWKLMLLFHNHLINFISCSWINIHNQSSSMFG
jgi:hypothetical protein